jgi:nucleotide-binding universal stress UspA family protein
VYHSILVPIDSDQPEGSARALEEARRLKRATGASLSLISIRHDIVVEGEPARPAYRRRLAEFLAKNGGTADLTEIREVGDHRPADIRSAAKEIGADLIVISSRDMHFTDCLIGPEATHLAMFAPCSVLLVR